MPALDSGLVGQRVLRLFDGAGWCSGTVKKFYTQSEINRSKDKFNCDISYDDDDGEVLVQRLHRGEWAQGDGVPSGSWVVARTAAPE
jgi:hypothetical protein